jgi:TolB-like protein/Tfp pilus assembly protein PilF
MPNNLSQFWQELKRRRVIHVITVYASASFVLIELVNNLTEPLNLPSSLATIVIIVLCVGFPLAVILSWIYDLTGVGIEKTRSIKEVSKEQSAKVPNAWKIATYVSFVVIIGLVTFNIVGSSNQLRAGDIQSLVILPFENYTGEDQLENMVSSMHSLLIGDMGRISGLRVIGRTSSKIYKDAGMSAKDIARELKVDAVVEGTVMCLGDSVCMQFRLLNAKGEERQIWIGDYHEDKGKVLNLYNAITKQIADEVRIELTPEEERLLAKKQTIDKDAFDAYLNSYAHWDDLSEESTRLAIEYLNTAVEKDPSWAPLWAGLAQLYGVRMQMGFESPETAIPQIFAYLSKALVLDPDYADIHFNKAVFGTWLEWNWEKGEKEFLEALAINPNDVMSRIYYAHLLNILQRNTEAMMQGKIAAELDPLNPLIQALYASVFIHMGSYDSAMVYLDKALALDPDHYFANGGLIMAGYHLREYERVFEGLGKTNTFTKEFMDSIKAIYRDQGYIIAYSKIIEQLDQLGIVQPVRKALWNGFLHRYDIVLDLLEKGYEVRDPNMPYIASKGHGFRDSLSGNPRYLTLLEKMRLPLPED